MPGGVWVGGKVGVPKNIMRALCAVIRPDHFKFASYGPSVEFLLCIVGKMAQDVGMV